MVYFCYRCGVYFDDYDLKTMEGTSEKVCSNCLRDGQLKNCSGEIAIEIELRR